LGKEGGHELGRTAWLSRESKLLTEWGNSICSVETHIKEIFEGNEHEKLLTLVKKKGGLLRHSPSSKRRKLKLFQDPKKKKITR